MTDVTVQIGDVIHVVVPDDGQDVRIVDPPDPPAPTIADLLAQSRAAHAQFQNHTGSINKDGTVRTPPNDLSAAQAIQLALNARALAEDADPKHADLAWDVDEQANRGVTSDQLLVFYREYLS